MNLLRAALARITARTFAQALLGNAALLLCVWAWLYIPDSHISQFLFSVLLGAVIVAGFLALHATIVRRLYPVARRPLWLSSLLVAGWLLLAHILQHLAGLLSRNVDTRAGYWNSQLSPHHRAFYTYQRLTDWQNLAIEALLWIVIPALVLPFAVEAINRTHRPWRAAQATLARPQLWLTIALAYVAGSWLGGHLLDWQPVHSVAGELISLALRTLLVYCLAVALLVFTLAVVVELLVRQHARWDPAP